MEHLLLKAAVTAATEEGLFTAVISAASIDREKDIVDPAGMVRALQKWVPTGKKVPLAWNHSTAPEHQIGYIDPATARVSGGEVVADGWIDQSTPSGEHAWRQVKAGTLGFSFGYLTLDSSPRKGGGRLLKELDVFEVTATPTPMNNDTRVLGWKAAADVEEQEADTLEVVLELLGDFLDTEDDAQDIATARDIIARVQTLLTTENAEVPDDMKAVPPDLSKTVTPAKPDIDEQQPVDGTAQAPGRAVDPLREKAQALALEIASGGMSLEQSPTPAQKAPPVLMPLDELRERMRVEMLTVLSGLEIEA